MADDNTPRKPFMRRLKDTVKAAGRFKSLWQYLLFVAIAGVFWFILTLNDEQQADFQVRVQIDGVPDSVTFITDPPQMLSVTVRDKGVALLRRRLMQTPVIHIPFSEYAAASHLRVGASAILTSLRGIFGSGANISVTSTDSLGLTYTTSPGKSVPVKVDADVTAALGKVVNGAPRINVREVTIYSVDETTDTVMYVTTMPIVRRDLSDSQTINVRLRPIKGVKLVPSSVEVTVNVEPLENRKVMVTVRPLQVPRGEILALFPQKVELSYLVPMSMGELPENLFRVSADYRDINISSSLVKVNIDRVPPGVQNAVLSVDSIEYTITRKQQ